MQQFINLLDVYFVPEPCPRLLKAHYLERKQRNQHMMTMQCGNNHLPTRLARLFRTQNSTLHCDPLDAWLRWLQPIPPASCTNPYLSLLHSPPLHLLSSGSCAPVLSQDLCTCSSSNRNPLHPLPVASFSLLSQLKCRFSEGDRYVGWISPGA